MRGVILSEARKRAQSKDLTPAVVEAQHPAPSTQQLLLRTVQVLRLRSSASPPPCAQDDTLSPLDSRLSTPYTPHPTP